MQMSPSSAEGDLHITADVVLHFTAEAVLHFTAEGVRHFTAEEYFTHIYECALRVFMFMATKSRLSPLSSGARVNLNAHI